MRPGVGLQCITCRHAMVQRGGGHKYVQYVTDPGDSYFDKNLRKIFIFG